MFSLTNNFNFDVRIEAKDFYGDIHTIMISGEQASKTDGATAKFEILKSENTACFSVSSEIKRGPAYDMRPTFSEYNSLKIFVKPTVKSQRVMGNYLYVEKNNSSWASEFFSDSICNIKNKTISLLWEQEDLFFYMMPLLDGDFKSELSSNGEELIITVSPETGGFIKIDAKVAVISWGKDPYEIISETVEKGFSYLGIPTSIRKNKKLPEIFSYLGWCSWDSCREDVSDTKIIEKAKEFKEKNVPVKWMLVDYGWYPTAANDPSCGSTLWDFYEDKNKFKSGIKAFVKTLKKDYCIENVGFWQCMTGDWRGISADGEIVKNHPELIMKTNTGEILPNFEKSGGYDFWNFWYSYLKTQGVDFVKVDVECNVENCLHGMNSVGKVVKDAFNAMDAVTAMYFSGAVINCTAMGLECLWTKPLGLINRNSTDYVQGEISTMGAFCSNNIYNSLYHSEFCHLDFDMFQTHDVTTKLNVILHALSGGLIYLSDHIGKTIVDIANAFSDCNGKLYKCHDYVRPTYDRLFLDCQNEKSLLKFFNVCNDSGYIGIMNIYKNNVEIEDSFSPTDVRGLSGDEYILYNFYNKKAEKISSDSKINVSLNQYDGDFYQIIPITDGFSFIGNTDKFICADAVVKHYEFNKKKVYILREGGTFSYYCQKNHEVYINGEKKDAESKGILKTVTVNSNEEVIFEIKFI